MYSRRCRPPSARRRGLTRRGVSRFQATIIICRSGNGIHQEQARSAAEPSHGRDAACGAGAMIGRSRSSVGRRARRRRASSRRAASRRRRGRRQSGTSGRARARQARHRRPGRLGAAHWRNVSRCTTKPRGVVTTHRRSGRAPDGFRRAGRKPRRGSVTVGRLESSPPAALLLLTTRHAARGVVDESCPTGFVRRYIRHRARCGDGRRGRPDDGTRYAAVARRSNRKRSARDAPHHRADRRQQTRGAAPVEIGHEVMRLSGWPSAALSSASCSRAGGGASPGPRWRSPAGRAAVGATPPSAPRSGRSSSRGAPDRSRRTAPPTSRNTTAVASVSRIGRRQAEQLRLHLPRDEERADEPDADAGDGIIATSPAPSAAPGPARRRAPCGCRSRASAARPRRPSHRRGRRPPAASPARRTRPTAPRPSAR